MTKSDKNLKPSSPFARPVISLGIVFALSAALGGCSTTSQKPKLSVVEAPPPNLKGGKDIDARMVARIAAAASQGSDATRNEALYKQLAESDPKDADSRVQLGRIHAARNEYDAAEGQFRTAVKIQPKNVDAWIGLTQVLAARQNPAGALATLEAGLKVNPNNGRMLNAKGVLLDQAGRHVEAQAVYRLALEGNPKDSMLQHNLGLSLAMSGQKAEAIALLKPLAEGAGATDEYRQSLAFAMKQKS